MNEDVQMLVNYLPYNTKGAQVAAVESYHHLTPSALLICLVIIPFINHTGQQNLTFFFGSRGKISNPNRTFKAEFKCVSSFSPSPTVCL